MTHPTPDEVALILDMVEKARVRLGLSRRQLADRLKVPFETLRRWFQEKSPKQPSAAHLSRLLSFAAEVENETSAWAAAWQTIKDWWPTQHRYSSLGELASEIGWDAQNLDACLLGGDHTPRLVIERLAALLGISTPSAAQYVAQARQRCTRIKSLLLLLYEELSWFRDGSQQSRDVFRSELDPYDVGYLSSLLTMLADERKFRRWLAATTHRFGAFKPKSGGHR